MIDLITVKDDTSRVEEDNDNHFLRNTEKRKIRRNPFMEVGERGLADIERKCTFFYGHLFLVNLKIKIRFNEIYRRIKMAVLLYGVCSNNYAMFDHTRSFVISINFTHK